MSPVHCPPPPPPPLPYVLRDVRLLVLEHSRWSMMEKYAALSAGLTPDKLMAFSRSFRAHLYAEGLVQGNYSSAVSAPSYATLGPCTRCDAVRGPVLVLRQV